MSFRVSIASIASFVIIIAYLHIVVNGDVQILHIVAGGRYANFAHPPVFDMQKAEFSL